MKLTITKIVNERFLAGEDVLVFTHNDDAGVAHTIEITLDGQADLLRCLLSERDGKTRVTLAPIQLKAGLIDDSLGVLLRMEDGGRVCIALPPEAAARLARRILDLVNISRDPQP